MINKIFIQFLKENIKELRIANYYYQEVITYIYSSIYANKKLKKKSIEIILNQNFGMRKILCHYKDVMRKNKMRITKIENQIKKALEGKLRGIPLEAKIKVTKNDKGKEYLKWLDSKPKVFLSFHEWMFTYHEKEFEAN